MAKKKILLVDDHAPTRTLVRTILESEKYENFEIVEAATGTECLKAMDKQGPFDLILLDVNLPDMDGYSVCRALRTVESKVPIVFVTAKGDMKDYAAGRAAGADSYLVKPIARGRWSGAACRRRSTSSPASTAPRGPSRSRAA